MLRNALIGLGALCLIAGAASMPWSGTMPGLIFAIWGSVLLLGTLYERFRYKALLHERPGGAIRTSERFIDDETGKTITVYVEPETGERSYVEE